MEPMEEMYTCDHCGSLHNLNDLYEWEGQNLCLDCLDELTVCCDECGERINREDNAGDDELVLCQNCYDDEFETCPTCGDIIRREYANYLNGEYYCSSCYEDVKPEDPIRSYYYKPAPIFYGTGPRYFGVELEMDEGGEDNDNAQTILDIGNAIEEERIYCKHDGSLDEGFEIVTHPMSLHYHLNVMPWKEILDKAVRMGYRSHQTNSCGFHIHVGRNALGENRDAQDTVIARILYFVEKHWEELLKFSRRTQRQLQRWAARYGYKNQPSDILTHAKTECNNDRYTCINLQNYGTIEFRIFRGTLKLNTILATLQLVDRICTVALSYSDQELQDLSWTSFVATLTEPELIQYLKERRLYINEPITTEEEL